MKTSIALVLALWVTCMLCSTEAQTFQYSHGWTNGRKRSPSPNLAALALASSPARHRLVQLIRQSPTDFEDFDNTLQTRIDAAAQKLFSPFKRGANLSYKNEGENGL